VQHSRRADAPRGKHPKPRAALSDMHKGAALTRFA